MVVENPNEGLTVKKNATIPSGVGQEHPPQEPSFADEYLKVRRQKKMEKLIEDEIGVGGKSKAEGEDLATTIVRAAMDSQADASKQYKELAERNDNATQKAREEADAAKRENNALVAQQITGALEGLVKMRDEIKNGNPQKPLLEQLEEARKIGAILNPQPAPVVSPPPSGHGDILLQMQLEQMRMTHELAMKKAEMEMHKMAQDLQIRLAELSDNHRAKEREYEDSKKFRENAFSTVTDILGAASAGFAQKAGGVPAAQAVTQTVESEAEPVIHSAEMAVNGKIIPGFMCKDCGTPIAVDPRAPEAVCPNPQCRARYSMVPGS